MSTANDTAKSTSVASTAAIGTMIRGKYTFVIRLPLPTRLLAEPVNADANSCHGSSPASANTGYGTPSDGKRARRPKTTVNTTIVASGCSQAHNTPNVVCL